MEPGEKNGRSYAVALINTPPQRNGQENPMKTRSSVGWGYFELRTNKNAKKNGRQRQAGFKTTQLIFFRGANLREVT